VLAGALSAAGLPADVAFSPAAFAVFGLAVLFNPLFAALLPVMLPVQNFTMSSCLYIAVVMFAPPQLRSCQCFVTVDSAPDFTTILAYGVHVIEPGGTVSVQIGSSAAIMALTTVLSPTFAVAAIVALPLSLIIFGVCLSAASVAFKWLVAGTVVPGVHRCKMQPFPAKCDVFGSLPCCIMELPPRLLPVQQSKNFHRFC
jgi:hypothetical protein